MTAGTLPRRRGRPPSAAPRLPPGPPPRVEAVERALSLLEAFDGAPRLALGELAARAGLYPSTVLRLAASLARFGYLHRDPDGAFRLGPTPLRLGLQYRDTFSLADRVRPALAALSARSGETAGFYVREGEHRICLFRHHPDRPIRHHVEEGSRLPLDRGAGGRILLAHTGGTRPEDAALRARGVCVSLGERDPETAAVAAPVFMPAGLAGTIVPAGLAGTIVPAGPIVPSGRAGRMDPSGFAGALGVVGARHRFDPATRDRLSALVVEAARDLSRLLGGLPPSNDPRGPQGKDAP